MMKSIQRLRPHVNVIGDLTQYGSPHGWVSESVADWRRLCGLLDIAWGLSALVADSEQRQALYTMVKRFKPGSLPATVDENLRRTNRATPMGSGRRGLRRPSSGALPAPSSIFTGFGDEQFGQPDGRAVLHRVIRFSGLALTIGPGWISLASSLRACSILGWARSRPG